jgi:hypothetical protein
VAARVEEAAKTAGSAWPDACTLASGGDGFCADAGWSDDDDDEDADEEEEEADDGEGIEKMTPASPSAGGPVPAAMGP